MKFEQHWPRGSRGEVIWNSEHFSHRNAQRNKLDLAVKRSNVNVRPLFSNFGRPPIPDDICKDSATRYPRFWRRSFLKVFSIYGHGGHLGQWTATILAIVHFPAPGRLQMKFEQCFYHIWAWWPSWSTDRDHFSNLLFPQPMKAPYEFWAKLAQGLQRRSRLKMLTDTRTDGWTDVQTDRQMDDGQKVITIAHPEHSSGVLKNSLVVCS